MLPVSTPGGTVTTTLRRVRTSPPQARAPELHIGWVPDRFLLLTQGDPPYVLAAGSAQATRATYPLQAALGFWAGLDGTKPMALTDHADARTGDAGTVAIGAVIDGVTVERIDTGDVRQKVPKAVGEDDATGPDPLAAVQHHLEEIRLRHAAVAAREPRPDLPGIEQRRAHVDGGLVVRQRARHGRRLHENLRNLPHDVEQLVRVAGERRLAIAVWAAGFSGGAALGPIVEEVKKNTWVEITITEGRNRLVKRMFWRIRNPVLKLLRVRFGNLTTDGLNVDRPPKNAAERAALRPRDPQVPLRTCHGHVKEPHLFRASGGGLLPALHHL